MDFNASPSKRSRRYKDTRSLLDMIRSDDPLSVHRFLGGDPPDDQTLQNAVNEVVNGDRVQVQVAQLLVDHVSRPAHVHHIGLIFSMYFAACWIGGHGRTSSHHPRCSPHVRAHGQGANSRGFMTDTTHNLTILRRYCFPLVPR